MFIACERQEARSYNVDGGVMRGKLYLQPRKNGGMLWYGVNEFLSSSTLKSCYIDTR